MEFFKKEKFFFLYKLIKEVFENYSILDGGMFLLVIGNVIRNKLFEGFFIRKWLIKVFVEKFIFVNIVYC